MNRTRTDICVVGLGPAGLGAALSLANSNIPRKVTCIEAGPLPESRLCTILLGKKCRRVVPCHVIGGVGGAALLSGGKISNYPAGRSLATLLGGEAEAESALERARAILEQYLEMHERKATSQQIEEEECHYASLGFDYRYYKAYRYSPASLVVAATRLIGTLREVGQSVVVDSEVIDVEANNGSFRLYVDGPGGLCEIETEWLIWAGGRLGHSTLRQLASAVNMPLKDQSCDVGVRLEFPVDVWLRPNDVHEDLKLHKERARTFCVCTEGILAPYRVEVRTEEGKREVFLVEGCSDPAVRTGFKNLGLTIRVSDYGVTGADMLHSFVDHSAMRGDTRPLRQSLPSFLGTNSSGSSSPSLESSISFWQRGEVLGLFPETIREEIWQAVGSFSEALLANHKLDNVSVFGPELDLYWPRVEVTSDFQAAGDSNLFIVGDAVGLFRGILQAFCTGLLCGEKVGKRI